MASRSQQPEWALDIEAHVRLQPSRRVHRTALAFRWLAEQMEDELESRHLESDFPEDRGDEATASLAQTWSARRKSSTG